MQAPYVPIGILMKVLQTPSVLRHIQMKSMQAPYVVIGGVRRAHTRPLGRSKKVVIGILMAVMQTPYVLRCILVKVRQNGIRLNRYSDDSDAITICLNRHADESDGAFMR